MMLWKGRHAGACLVCMLLIAVALPSQAASPRPGVDLDVQDDGGRIVVDYTFSDYVMNPVEIDGAKYVTVELGRESQILQAGSPDVPNVRRSVIIPDDAKMKLNVLTAEFIDIEGVDIAPSKGNLYRTVDPAEVPFTFGDVYKENAFYPGTIASIGKPYILRSHRGAVIEINPFQYNPVKRLLRVYTHVAVEVISDGPAEANELTYRPSTVSRAFHQIYGNQFINYEERQVVRYDPIDEQGDMLIICHDAWLSNVAPLVAHKTSIGINTTVVGVSTIGNNATAITNYIANLYNTSDLAFVLLVGDHDEVASPYASGGAADPVYAKIAGSDDYPELIVGRFCAETAAEVDTQVERTVDFELNQATTMDWFWRGTGIGSGEGSGIGDEGQSDPEHLGEIRTWLLAGDYTEVDELYVTVAPSEISTALNAGRGIVNYTGHGSETTWVTSGYSNSDINALVNDGMLPFIVSVACVNGAYDYTGGDCFAEAWMQATNGGNPTGAVGIYASSINQSWAPPMEGQDEFNILFTSSEEPYRSVGALCFAGSCSMMDDYGADGVEMYDTWHIFGDPSLCVIGVTASDVGRVVLDRPKYKCDGTVGITVADMGLNTDELTIESATVLISSDSEPAGETVTVYEQTVSSPMFMGSIMLSDVDSAGVLQVADGDTITLTYIDADDGEGNYNVPVIGTAVVDCAAPVVSNIQVVDLQPRSATVTFDANELVKGTVHYGVDCSDLSSAAVAGGYANPAEVLIEGLQDSQTYFYVVEAEDEAGNSVLVDNGHDCFDFTTPDVPDFFTEQFESGLDVDGMQLFFIPNGSFDYYMGCNYDNLISLPTDPTGGTALSLTDDDTQEISLTDGAQVYIYGQAYSSVWICSNGHLTFGVEDDEHIETLEDHFSNPRVAALFDDLNPVDGGTISYKQLSDRFVVTWQNVPQYNTTGDSNTFQAELFFDGMITLSYLGIGTSDAIIGLSDGSGLDPDFYASDLSNMGPCGDRPPSASGGSAHADLNTAITIDLIAGDDGQPDPPAALTYIVTALPANGTLSDPGAGAIASVPYTLVGGGNAVVYSPSYNYQGPDSLQYKANDGGIAPDGGDSNIATVSITVGGPAAVHSFPLDEDPMWTTEGQWAFGQPTGEGSHNLDPIEGYTGRYVYGYNLEGDYPHSMGEMALTTGAMDCTDVTSVELHFWRWLGVESASYDHARIDVSNDGVNWVLVWNHTATTAISDSSWNEMIYDVSAVADNQPTVFFRWIMGGTDTSVSYPGWNIDDIEIWGVVPLNECPFDLDGSGFVGTGDINLIKANYGAVTPETEAFDLDGSGFVGTGDINLIKANYGPCP